ncbi:MAG TPA: hypothetical protein VIU83_03150 [Candidatus Deferrimicrobium sp.]
MTGLLRGHEAPLSARFKTRFLVLLSFIHAFGMIFLFLALFIILSRPFPGDYSAVFLALRHLPAFLLPVIVISGFVSILLVCMAMAVLCVYKLHRIAGPLYRMERVVESYLAGEAVKPAFFREGDQVPALASAFNGFIGRLREDRQRWLGKMEHAERLCFQDRATCRSEMEKTLAELKILLAKYR